MAPDNSPMSQHQVQQSPFSVRGLFFLPLPCLDAVAAMYTAGLIISLSHVVWKIPFTVFLRMFLILSFVVTLTFFGLCTHVFTLNPPFSWSKCFVVRFSLHAVDCSQNRSLSFRWNTYYSDVQTTVRGKIPPKVCGTLSYWWSLSLFTILYVRDVACVSVIVVVCSL